MIQLLFKKTLTPDGGSLNLTVGPFADTRIGYVEGEGYVVGGRRDQNDPFVTQAKLVVGRKGQIVFEAFDSVFDEMQSFDALNTGGEATAPPAKPLRKPRKQRKRQETTAPAGPPISTTADDQGDEAEGEE